MGMGISVICCMCFSRGSKQALPGLFYAQVPRTAKTPQYRAFPQVRAKMQLVDWWTDRELFHILPDRIYFFLGAGVSDSEGEAEWDKLVFVVLSLQAPRWTWTAR